MMKYESLYADFIKLFPNDKEKLEEHVKALEIDPSDGMHIMFGMVVVPFIIDLVKKDEHDKLEKAFSFFEDMIKDKNNLVSEVVEFTILEDLISSGQDILDKCKAYMGNETLYSCDRVEHLYSNQ